MNTFKKIFLLTKVFFKSGSNMEMQGGLLANRKKKKSGIWAKVGMFFAYAFLLVYLGVVMVGLGNMLAPTLISLGLDTQYFEMFLALFAIMTVLYGFFSVFSSLAFSKDQERLMSMPFRRGEILVSRFIVLLVQQSILPLIMGVPLFFTYAYHKGSNWIFYVKSVIGLMLQCAVPVAILVIISILLMRLTPLAKNKDRFMIIMQVIMIGTMIAFYILSNQLFQSDGDDLIVQQQVLQNSIFEKVKYAIPTLPFVRDFILEDGAASLLALVKIILISLAFIVVSYFIADRFYSPEQSGGGKRKKMSEAGRERVLAPRSTFCALFRKEAKLVFRNPSILTNNVISVFIFPVMMLLGVILGPALSKGEGGIPSLASMREEASFFFQTLDDEATIMIIAVASLILSIISFVVVSTNSMNASAVSREGEQIMWSLTMPVSYKKQYAAKTLLAILVSVPLYLIILLAGCFVLSVPVKIIIIPLVTFIWGSVNANLLPLLFDAWLPVLDWENEIYAIKQNKSILFGMLLNWLVAGLFGLTIYLMLGKELFEPLVGIIIALAIHLVLSVVLLTLIPRALKRTMGRIENYL